MIIDSTCHLGNHSEMTVGESPDKHASEDDPELLAGALNYVWARYDGRRQRSFQILNYYLVAIAILVTAYTTAIKDKNYGIAAVPALAGLGLTALVIVGLLHEQDAANSAKRPLAELQGRVAGRLRVDSIPEVGPPRGGRWGRVVVASGFALAALLNIGALLYALVH
jgi:hypothetical protein